MQENRPEAQKFPEEISFYELLDATTDMYECMIRNKDRF